MGITVLMSMNLHKPSLKNNFEISTCLILSLTGVPLALLYWAMLLAMHHHPFLVYSCIVAAAETTIVLGTVY